MAAGILAYGKSGFQPPATSSRWEPRRCQVVFYFVLLLPQFDPTSVNTRDFAPKLRIAHKHRIESDVRETQSDAVTRSATFGVGILSPLLYLSPVPLTPALPMNL